MVQDPKKVKTYPGTRNRKCEWGAKLSLKPSTRRWFECKETAEHRSNRKSPGLRKAREDKVGQGRTNARMKESKREP